MSVKIIFDKEGVDNPANDVECDEVTSRGQSTSISPSSLNLNLSKVESAASWEEAKGGILEIVNNLHERVSRLERAKAVKVRFGDAHAHAQDLNSANTCQQNEHEGIPNTDTVNHDEVR